MFFFPLRNNGSVNKKNYVYINNFMYIMEGHIIDILIETRTYSSEFLWF